MAFSAHDFFSGNLQEDGGKNKEEEVKESREREKSSLVEVWWRDAAAALAVPTSSIS